MAIKNSKTGVSFLTLSLSFPFHSKYCAQEFSPQLAMNPLLYLGALNAHRRVRMFKCLYCRRAFSSSRTLAGHLRTHHPAEIRERGNLLYPVCCFDILGLSGMNVSQLLGTQLENSFGIHGNTLPFLYGENLSAGINWSFLSCPRPGMFNSGNFGNAVPSVTVPPNHSVASDGAQVHPSNLMFSASIASPVNGGTSNAFAPSPATSFLSVSVVCHDRAGHPNPVSATENAHSAPNLNQSAGLNNPAYGFVPQGMSEDEDDLSYEDNAESDISEEVNAISFEGSGSFSVGVSEDSNIVSAPEEPNLSFHPMIQSENPQPKELVLFKDPKLPFPGLENSGDGEVAGQGGLDLSLCL